MQTRIEVHTAVYTRVDAPKPCSEGEIHVMLLDRGISLSGEDVWRQSNYANEWIMCGKPIRVQSLWSHDTSCESTFYSSDLQGG